MQRIHGIAIERHVRLQRHELFERHIGIDLLYFGPNCAGQCHRHPRSNQKIHASRWTLAAAQQRAELPPLGSFCMMFGPRRPPSANRSAGSEPSHEDVCRSGFRQAKTVRKALIDQGHRQTLAVAVVELAA
jgi:hypothetical protein